MVSLMRFLCAYFAPRSKVDLAAGKGSEDIVCALFFQASKQRLERIFSRFRHKSATLQKTTTATDVHRRVKVTLKVRV